MAKFKLYTLWIAAIMAIVFLLQNIFPSFESSLILNQNSVLEIWRFATALFLHASISHLAYNLIALLLFGLMLEKIIGSNRFLAVFFVSGILANIISVNFYPVSLGASGAIMGIIGALAVIRPMMGVWAFGMIIPMFVAAIIWVGIDLFGIFTPDNIGHIAHISGIFFGIIFGIIFRTSHEYRKKRHTIEVPEHMLRRWEAIYMGGE